MSDDLIDDDGYPTDEALKRVSTWAINSQYDCRMLLEFVRMMWHYEDYVHVEEKQNDWGEPIFEYAFATGGWSGNEELVSSLKSNNLFWVMCWYSSRRGGHYVFQVRKE